MQERKVVNNMKDKLKKINELTKEISNLLWKRYGENLSKEEAYKLDWEIKGKKEELYKLQDECELYKDEDKKDKTMK